MNINCVICSDIFEPSSEVYVTQCGHMFHFTCLMHWIERSKTCPQCRNKCTEKTIHRVYFNLSNTDNLGDDVGMLQMKLDNLQFQITLKDKDIKNFSEKYSKMKNRSIGLRQEVQQLENKHKVSESVQHALKEQISYFKSKARDSERLTEELNRLKSRLKDADHVQLAINGTREEVNEMLRNEHNVESLAILAATLKKSLLDAEHKKRDMEYKLKIAQNDATKYKREVNCLDCKYDEARKELEQSKGNWSKERFYLKSKIMELHQKLSNKTDSDIVDTSINRIVDESPVNFNRRPKLNSCEIDLTETASPNLNDKVKQIVDSDSPYLPVKSCSVGLLNTKFSAKPSTSNKYTIFKAAPPKLENVKLNTLKNDELNYNGLGGTSKDDVFPSPKSVPNNLKRPRSKTSMTSVKFRKLAPNPVKITKISEFLDKD